MFKTSIAIAFLAAGLAGPAFAADDLCNDGHMKQMDAMIAKMSDAAKQKEATAALDASKAAMKAGDNGGCLMQITHAHAALAL
jgi:hypothetical protein